MAGKKQMVEITRSFSYKLNLGNFSNADFFCSEKAEVPEEDADIVSEALYQFCKEQVIKSRNEFAKEIKDSLPIKLSSKFGQKAQVKQEESEELGVVQLEEDKIREANEVGNLAQEAKLTEVQ